jgi:hypothetical protein
VRDFNKKVALDWMKFMLDKFQGKERTTRLKLIN